MITKRCIFHHEPMFIFQADSTKGEENILYISQQVTILKKLPKSHLPEKQKETAER